MNTELIPKDKADTETADRLKNYSYSEVKDIIPDLLVWLQDMNWPVARPVAEYLKTFTDNISSEIIKILQGDDEVWKYWIIANFGPLTKNQEVLTEIKRIAVNPTKTEVMEEIDEMAREILERREKQPDLSE
jgi:hypothetical protein